MIKRIALAMLIAGIVVVFGAFAINYYRAQKATSEPPQIIFERTDRPSRV
ncbi:MAG: hypothetical protein K2X60_08345 [Xanthobacteraceae bacterium]|nr:hypothetical protein [Xanthobacteraceae bacterium]